MKKAIIIVVLFLCVIFLVNTDIGLSYAEETMEPTEESQLTNDDIDDLDDVVPEESATKKEKVVKTISEVPEKTGNIFLKGFHKVGDAIENATGNRFETKWSGDSKEDPQTDQKYGYNRDPAGI